MHPKTLKILGVLTFITVLVAVVSILTAPKTFSFS